MSWYFGDDDDLSSFQDIPDHDDEIHKEDRDDDILDIRENSSNQSLKEYDSNVYRPSPTPSKHYYSHRRNESKNVARTFQSSHDLRNSHDHFDRNSSHENVDSTSENDEKESIFVSEDEDLYKLDKQDDCNQVLHKYGFHRDETTMRTERFTKNKDSKKKCC